MEPLILSIQGIHYVSHAKITFATSTAAYCRKETLVKIIKVRYVQSD